MDNVLDVDHHQGLDNLRAPLYQQSRWNFILVLVEIVKDTPVGVVLEVNVVTTLAGDP